MAAGIPHQRFRIPRDDRSLFSIPPRDQAPALLRENRQLFATSHCALNGRSLIELRSAAQTEALACARSYTESLLNTQLPDYSAESIVVSGHQPELFHVGVWAKNFALAGVARQSRAAAINLIIDNDTMNGTSLRIPAGSRDQLRVERAAYDTPRSELPWEEARIEDLQTFTSFGSRVSERIHSMWRFQPLLESAWPAAIQQVNVSPRLCDSFTALRTNVERSWGLENLELPMSRLCETPTFLWFVAHLLMRLPELHAIYNEAVAAYRQQHRIRSRMQPVPDLEGANGWLEAPFWIWRKGDNQRGRLFARRSGSFCELRHETDLFARVPLTNIGSLEAAVAVLSDLPKNGYRLRTRALTTTLFARLFLSDLFVHGIGGAKYDEMTDQLCERLFGLPAPGYLTVSATLYLPLGGPHDVTEIQWREINHKVRDLTYNPDRHLSDTPANRILIEEKSRLITAAADQRAAKQLRGHLSSASHRRLAEIRKELSSQTAAVRSRYELSRSTLQAQRTANSLIRNREYSFVLYPENLVREFLLPLSAPSVPGEPVA